MQSPQTEFIPADLNAGDRYKLLIGMIVPRPIAFVSTVSPNGKTNLAPFSFFCGVGSEPMTLAFCPAADERGRELLPRWGGRGAQGWRPHQPTRAIGVIIR